MTEEEAPEVDGRVELDAFLAGLTSEDCTGGEREVSEVEWAKINRGIVWILDVRTECVLVDLSKEL